MKCLKYSLRYTPSITSDWNLNYLCRDSCIHVRLHDFNKPQRITGFERKLEYLIAYLLHFCFQQTGVSNYSFDQTMKNFSRSFLEPLEDQIRQLSGYNEKISELKHIKIRKNYRQLIDNYSMYGSVTPEFFPECVLDTNPIDAFLNVFNINLGTYLFDDRYSILLENSMDDTVNEKFIKKAQKLDALKIRNMIEYSELW